MKLSNKAILPKGFRAQGASCGIKKSGKPDLALFYSESPCFVSGKFTTNSMAAAPVKLGQRSVKMGKACRALLVNSGNANAYTGKQGLQDAFLMRKAAAAALSIEDEQVLVASTGIIGKVLPVDKIKACLPGLVKGLTARGIARAEKAIQTTDKFNKEITAKFKVGSAEVTLCAVAKGAGMIAPNMATMLVFIFTDAAIIKSALDRALTEVVASTFNCMTVDGCMSTNDTVFLLANGQAANTPIGGGHAYGAFKEALRAACLYLGKMIIRDGEGSTKCITLEVKGAASGRQAHTIALAVANSNLFKTAMFASSANILGRIVASVGASGAGIKEEALSVRYSPLKKKDVHIRIVVGKGKGKAVVYTSDLSYEYIKINAAYN